MSRNGTQPETEAARDEGGARASLSLLRARREWGDAFVGLALLAMAAWFWTTASGLDDYSGESIGAADFPRGLSALLAIGALVLIASAAWRLATGALGHLFTVERPLRVLIGMALLIAFPALMTTIGYYPAMAVWLPLFLWLADVRRPVVIIACVIGFLLFTKIVFELILNTPFS